MIPARQVPYVGMPVWIVHLGVVEASVVSAIGDDARTLTVDGDRYTLRRANGRYVREDEPSYGVRLSLRPVEAA